MNKSHQLCSFLGSAILGMIAVMPAFADDTETLVGGVLYEGPNVTLIIDTSGSMGSNVLLNAASYNPATVYTGPYTNSNKLFYTRTYGSSINFPDANDTNLRSWIVPNRLRCQAAIDALNVSGYFTDRFAQFDEDGDGGTWRSLNDAGSGSPTDGEFRITECKSDNGVHGYSTSSAPVYPVSPTGVPAPFNINRIAWTANATHNRIVNWNNTGSTYTFFSNNFLNWIAESAAGGTPVVQTRLEIVKSVASQLISDLKVNSLLTKDELRLGLMRFSTNSSGGMLLKEVADITAGTNENDLISMIQNLNASGYTPLAETMYEAKRYYAGETMVYGNNSSPVNSVSASHNGTRYHSPIIGECQKSYVVLLTDGQPTRDGEADGAIGNLTGGACTGSCLDELSVYMHANDLATGSSFPGRQSVDTFVIGFFTDFALLKDTATGKVLYDANGVELATPQDGYFLADNPDDLANAFKAIFKNVTNDVRSFTSPAISVNSLNRLTNRETLYFAMFDPSKRGEPHWDGNLKAYRIGSAGGDITILDANGNPALDANGVFNSSAQSVWSLKADGGNVKAGGVVERLSANRNIYSNLTSANLNAPSNRVGFDANGVPNPLLTRRVFGVAAATTNTQLLELVNFARGVEADGSTPRKVLGDPLHSQPVVVTYANGGSESLRVFFGTNDGYIHAINPATNITGNVDLEEFAFIPKELLDNIPILKTNQPSSDPTGNKAYGMDGPITTWIDESVKNNVVNSGEDLYVYAGMRRGGSSYYALEASNPSDPKLKFSIDSSNTGFGKLGQTWSALTHGKIRLGGTDRDVLFFGGGYDTDQDDDNNEDNVGNAIYIADAKDGSFVWSASDSGATLNLPEMKHSIPSDVRTIDIDQDGYIDRLYVGDMGAKVWRVDINNHATNASDAISGGLLADLSNGGSDNERRFYSAPSVAAFREDGRTFLTVSIGSGYRAHPLDKDIDDRFYVLRDNNVTGPALVNGVPAYGNNTQPPSLIKENDLIVLDGQTAINDGQFGNGWMLKLEAGNGEKALSRALTVNGQILFTSYTPGSSVRTCDSAAAPGTARLYAIDVLTGLPARFEDPVTQAPVYSTELEQGGIQPSPQYIFTPIDKTSNSTIHDAVSQGVIGVGTEIMEENEPNRPVKTFWYNTEID